ncbi:hypothetical protein BT96DRAFT_756868, partial [Gymnopus androsaceus JB14]
WWEKRRNYPKLAQMPLDYLDKASSTAVECIFSQGRHLLSFTWNQLNGYSIQMCMCMG